MSDPIDEQMLRRAIRLAMRGRGTTEPNPSVGCVLVKDGIVIGEGHTQPYGGAHAEPTALAACAAAGHSSAGATAYVTLEPCCHLDKQTPPCAPRLIAAKIARVFVGCLDPNPKVNGRGVEMLRKAGVRVDLAAPPLEAEAKQVIAPFIARTILQRPYVTLKWAQTNNGRIAGPMGARVRITNEASDRVIHAMRGRCDAIAVGTNTVLNDDPLLTVRRASPGPRTPIRIVLSNTLKVPLNSKLVQSARDIPLIIYCSKQAADLQPANIESLREAGVEVMVLPDRDQHFSFAEVLADLYTRRITHLLIEPGPTLARSFFARGQADRVWRFTSSKRIDAASDSISSAPKIVDYPMTDAIDIDGDRLEEFLNPQSHCYFASVPSADFEIARDNHVTVK